MECATAGRHPATQAAESNREKDHRKACCVTDSGMTDWPGTTPEPAVRLAVLLSRFSCTNQGDPDKYTAASQLMGSSIANSSNVRNRYIIVRILEPLWISSRIGSVLYLSIIQAITNKAFGIGPGAKSECPQMSLSSYTDAIFMMSKYDYTLCTAPMWSSTRFPTISMSLRRRAMCSESAAENSRENVLSLSRLRKLKPA